MRLRTVAETCNASDVVLSRFSAQRNVKCRTIHVVHVSRLRSLRSYVYRFRIRITTSLLGPWYGADSMSMITEQLESSCVVALRSGAAESLRQYFCHLLTFRRCSEASDVHSFARNRVQRTHDSQGNVTSTPRTTKFPTTGRR